MITMNFIRKFYYGDIPEDKAGAQPDTSKNQKKVRLATVGSFHSE